MERTRKRSKEILQVAVASALSIALFSTALIGVNSLAFATATNGAETLPAAEAYVDIHNNIPSEGFVAPNLTLLECRWQGDVVVPESAMSKEDAAQIGAQYIWDVFGESIDGMYVSMGFEDWPNSTRTFWRGSVGQSEAFNRDSDIFFSFLIDAVTGQRIDIDNGMSGIPMFIEEADIEEIMSWRFSVMDSGYFEMSAQEQKDFVGLSNDMLEAYKQTALELASRHFNNSEVTDIVLGTAWGISLGIAPVRGADGTLTFGLGSLTFTATDNTGREAYITIPAGPGATHTIYVGTSHNDIIPDFVWPERIEEFEIIDAEDGSGTFVRRIYVQD